MGMPLSAQEVLENLKDRWYQADSPPSDLLLTEDEFLSFLHPEHSRGMLKFMAKEIVRDLGEAWPGTLPCGGVWGAPRWWLGWRAEPAVPLQQCSWQGSAWGSWRLWGPTVVWGRQALSWAIWPRPGSRAGQVRRT